VLDVLPESPDWAETAALIAALRCVVSVDTAVAHLAGATGALVHLLVQRPNPVFYGEEPRPFYPSMTVHLKGDAAWSEVVGRVAAALAA
jgi:ADP-heptose:LPS heptosyltransferase